MALGDYFFRLSDAHSGMVWGKIAGEFDYYSENGSRHRIRLHDHLLENKDHGFPFCTPGSMCAVWQRLDVRSVVPPTGYYSSLTSAVLWPRLTLLEFQPT